MSNVPDTNPASRPAKPARAPGEHPAPPECPLTNPELAALLDRLNLVRETCYVALRHPDDIGYAVVPTALLVALNADFELVRAANAELAPHQRSAAIAAAPNPMFPPGRLCGPRNLRVPLGQAIATIEALLKQRKIQAV